MADRPPAVVSIPEGRCRRPPVAHPV